MLPACVSTCKIVTHILSGFTLEDNVKRLIENTMIDKKGTSAYKNRKKSALDGRCVFECYWLDRNCVYICSIHLYHMYGRT